MYRNVIHFSHISIRAILATSDVKKFVRIFIDASESASSVAPNRELLAIYNNMYEINSQ